MSLSIQIANTIGEGVIDSGSSPVVDNGILLEDGTNFIELEDGSGIIIKEEPTP